jgi:hypothetical protein
MPVSARTAAVLAITALGPGCGQSREPEVQALQAELERTRAELLKANQAIAELEAEFAGGGRVPFPPQPDAFPPPDLDAGNVLAVNPTAGTAVISRGSSHGVKVGFEYIVARGNKYVGMLRLRQVREKDSTGALVPGMQKSPIRVDDWVVAR